MGKKNRRKRYVHNADGLGGLRVQCPLCNADLWKCWGSRNDKKGQWNICTNNQCPYDEFVSDDGAFTATTCDATSTDTKPTATATTPYTALSRKCDHWRDVVKVGDGVVTVSAHSDKPRENEKDDTAVPDLGMYLSVSWQDRMSPIWGAGIKTPYGVDSYPSVYCKWADYGVVDISVVTWMVKAIRTAMEKGLSVDIGCQGGHGRTGTLLACLIAHVEGLDSANAIKAVHKRHCKEAVESLSQENLVREYCGEEKLVIKQVPTWRMYIQGHRLSYTMTNPRRK